MVYRAGNRDKEVKKARDEEDTFREAFPGLSLEEEDEQEAEDIHTIYLWETNAKVYELFTILIPYLGEYCSLSPASSILLKLIEEQDLPVTKTLFQIPYICGGFSDKFIGNTND